MESKKYIETARYRIILGTIGFCSAIIMTFMDMFSNYTANDSLVNNLYYVSAILVGAGIAKTFSKNNTI